MKDVNILHELLSLSDTLTVLTNCRNDILPTAIKTNQKSFFVLFILLSSFLCFSSRVEEITGIWIGQRNNKVLEVIGGKTDRLGFRQAGTSGGSLTSSYAAWANSKSLSTP